MKIPSLRRNIAAMTIVQAMSYILPLVTLPYLTRTLGLEAFGQIIFVQLILQYFILITDWGFLWSATKEIALVRHQPEVLSKLFISTWLAQWLLLLMSAIMLFILVVIIPALHEHAIIYWVGFSLVVGNVLFPIWLLQGLECLERLAKIQLITRPLVIPLIFLCVNKPEDSVWAIAVLGGVSILTGLLTQIWIWRYSGITWHPVSIYEIFGVLRNGFGLFFSKIWISLYTTLIPLVLGSIAGHSAVAIYSLADKFKSAAQSFLSPISQALFPRMSHLYKHDYAAAYQLLIKSGVIILSLSIAASLALFFAADWIIYLFGGDEFKASVEVLRWLSLLPCIVACSNLLGVQVMLPANKIRAFNVILVVAGGISLLLMYPLIHSKGAVGAAINTLITELFVSVSMAFYVLRMKKHKTYKEAL